MTAPTGTFRCAERGTLSPLAEKRWEATGDYRAPLEGEWYIVTGVRFSEARRAHENYADPQWIALEAAA